MLSIPLDTCSCALLVGQAAGLGLAVRWWHAARTAGHAADHDALTGLPNRRALDRRLACAPIGTWVGILDLDRFKAVNDLHGHHAGDAVLIVVADRLAPAAERAGGWVARLGGDEFAVLLPPPTAVPPGQPAEARPPAHLALTAGADLLARTVTSLAEGILRTVDGVVNLPEVGVAVTVSASLGLARLDHAGPRLALGRADTALYAARAAGVHLDVYDPARHPPVRLDEHARPARRRRDRLAPPPVRPPGPGRQPGPPE